MIFRRFTRPAAPPAKHALSHAGLCCPRCRSPVFNIARRAPDLIVSLFVALRRYRCISMQCSWEGNLRAKRSTLLPQTLL